MTRRLIAFLGLGSAPILAQTKVSTLQLQMVPPTFEQVRPTLVSGKTWSLPKTYSFVMVFLNGVYQTPGFDYNLSGTQITFIDLTPSGADILSCVCTV